jgi:hypothetical protein
VLEVTNRQYVKIRPKLVSMNEIKSLDGGVV